jgi:ribosomal protein L11 methyltransferase
MSWLQIHLTTEQARAPLAERLLEELGALSVTLTDAADQALLEPAPGETPLWRQTRVTGLFAGDLDTDLLRDRIHQALASDLSRQLHLEMLEERVWERVWLDNFQPMQFGQRLWVCPADQSPPKGKDQVVVRLDPGLAFGTGTHPTTALCLRWLDGADLADHEVIDFGCGSGILSIAALKLGARRVIAVDHDPQALEATRANAEKNGVSDRLRVELSDETPERQTDLLLANILAGTLIELEPMLAGRIRSGGSLVLSGILVDQTNWVNQGFRHDFVLKPARQQEDWVLIEGVRR